MSAAEQLGVERAARLRQQISSLGAQVQAITPIREGRLVRMVGTRLEVAGCTGAVGSRCSIQAEEERSVEAEDRKSVV